MRIVRKIRRFALGPKIAWADRMSVHPSRFSFFALGLVILAFEACNAESSTASSADASGDRPNEIGDDGSEPDAGVDASGDALGEAGDDAAACQGPHLESAACEACQNQKCCVTAANCVGDPDCIALQDCVNSGAPCPSAHQAGIWNFSGLQLCRENSCASECGLQPAKCGNIVPTPASCLGEVQQKCCPETATCGANESCVALIYQCIDQNECSDSACLSDCEAKYPDGVADFEAMVSCWAQLTCL